MKSLLVIVGFAFLGVCLGVDIEDVPTSFQPGEIFGNFARNEGIKSIFQLSNSQAPADETIIQTPFVAQENTYLLYTRNNPSVGQILRLGNLNDLLISNYDGNKNTVVLASDWNSNGTDEMSRSLTQVFLQDGDTNVVVLNWSSSSSRVYSGAKKGVLTAGRGLGLLITWLVAVSTNYDKIYLVGFGMGAHIMGYAGRLTGSRCRRITGLDPSGHLFQDDSNRLASTDAEYVEVMHTSPYGINTRCGDADFFPNGGSRMPGCLTALCSHNRSFQYMVASVRHNRMLANECSSVRQAKGFFRCRGATALMGNSDLTKSRSGIFKITTRIFYPYI